MTKEEREQRKLFALPMLVGHLLRSGNVPTIGERQPIRSYDNAEKRSWPHLRRYRVWRKWPKEVD